MVSGQRHRFSLSISFPPALQHRPFLPLKKHWNLIYLKNNKQERTCGMLRRFPSDSFLYILSRCNDAPFHVKGKPFLRGEERMPNRVEVGGKNSQVTWHPVGSHGDGERSDDTPWCARCASLANKSPDWGFLFNIAIISVFVGIDVPVWSLLKACLILFKTRFF